MGAGSRESLFKFEIIAVSIQFIFMVFRIYVIIIRKSDQLFRKLLLCLGFHSPMLVIIKSGMTGFLLVPGLLGLLDELLLKVLPEKHQQIVVTRRKSLTDEVVDVIRQNSKEKTSQTSKDKEAVAAAA